MASNSNIVQLMKRAAIEAVDASKPCIIKLGRVKTETRVVLLRQQGGGKYLVLDVLD